MAIFSFFRPKRTTIFKQLVLNVIIPAVIALVIWGIINIYQTKKILNDAENVKKELIFSELKNILEFRDVALEILEQQLNPELKKYSQHIISQKVRNTENIQDLDLVKIQSELGMDTSFYDIYIINREGVVINTTFQQDSGLNLFDFGDDHKRFLIQVFENKEFTSEKFAIEASTRRLKKYTYQPTLDEKYLVEIGFYSKKADEIVKLINDRINTLSLSDKRNIISVDLFISEDAPFSVNKDVSLSEEELKILRKVMKTEQTIAITKKAGRQLLHKEYLYMERTNSDLYGAGVIRIITDRMQARRHVQTELLRFLLIFGLIIFVVIVMIYKNTKVITDPIKRLVENVNRITNGHLDERAEVIGNNEIASLSEKFNQMVERLENYYKELEQKVKERTAEIFHQKEEIEAQRDSLQSAYLKIEEQNIHITDSIKYAKRIQNAILPPSSYVHELLPDSFIFYLPKDIVSGDFYYVNEVNNKVCFAAIDCTGHGVPGAFMSIVGRLHIDYVINVLGAKSSGQILDMLNKEVTDFLAQKKAVSAIKDGMDLALCILDKKAKKLEYSGAYNPLIIIRDNELIQYKGSRHPIGAFIEDDLRPFITHSIDLKKGDIIYIFSDGYADQFGGEEDKKYMQKQFKSLLLSIHQKPVEEQKSILLNEFYNWKGEREQIDDLLIMGIKID